MALRGGPVDFCAVYHGGRDVCGQGGIGGSSVRGGGNIQMTQGFWGILYPEYCYSEKPSDEISAKPRFTFRWLRTPNFGDKIGEKHQSESSYEIR